MDKRKLCESDARFMRVIWDNEPLSSARLVELCAEQFGWKKSTTYTMLKKLSEKGLAQNRDTVVTSLVPQSEVDAYRSDYFVSEAFNGSLPRFLAAFFDGRTISEGEADELKRLIDSHRRI